MSGDVVLFYMPRAPGGGSTSFAVHLHRGMQLAGLNPMLYRVTQRGEDRTRQLAKYDGVYYRNVSPAEAERLVTSQPSLMVAACSARDTPWDTDIIPRLIAKGMRVVAHDPNEFKIYDHHGALQALGAGKVRPVIAIRPTMLAFYPDAVVIPHPYVRCYDNDEEPLMRWPELNAVSVARVSFVKRTELILDANRLLPDNKKVVLRGAENRLYTRHRLRDLYPEFKSGSTGTPLAWHAGAKECRRASYAIDMTYFPQDGGGSQYSFMEAWDAGAVNVIHSDWLRYCHQWPCEMDARAASGNCMSVGSAAELAKVLEESLADLAPVVHAGYAALAKHDAATVAHAYYEELTR